MPEVWLTDTCVLDGARRSTDGYLAGTARISRVGTQVYSGKELGKPELASVTLYRPEAEVFDEESMRSMAHKPLTLLHPPNLVDSKNWGKFGRGHSGDKVVRDGDFVSVPMLMMDQATIDAFESGEARELSVGYSAILDWTPGTAPDGVKYDAIQTKIRGNHFALCPAARGGSSLRFGDGMKCADCGAASDAKYCKDCSPKHMKDEGNPMTAFVIVDGTKLEVADGVTAAVIEKREAQLVKLVADSQASIKALLEEAKAATAAHVVALDALKADVGAKVGEIAVLKQQVEDAKMTPERLTALTAERNAVVDSAKGMLPEGFVFDSKTDSEIRRAAVTAKLGDEAVKGWSDKEFGGAFGALKLARGDDGLRRLGDALGGGGTGGGGGGSSRVDPRKQAYLDAVKRDEDAWKKPIPQATH